MGIAHYESGQKADIRFESKKANIIPIILNVRITSIAHAFSDVVPVGKRWVLRALTLQRDNSGDMQIQFVDATPGNDVIIAQKTGTILMYQPTDLISLSSGWSIRSLFGAGANGTIWTRLLVEEENEY